MTLSDLTNDDYNRISRRWVRMKELEQDHVWGTFDNFVLWSVNNGYTPCAVLLNKADKDSENFSKHWRWRMDIIPKEDFVKWDDTVGLIRARLHMKPIATVRNPCSVCSRDATCTQICRKRAAYWDYFISTLRGGVKFG